MSSTVPPPDAEERKPSEPAWREFARAPLVPVALAATLGLIVDRYGDLSAFTELALGFAALVAWVISWKRPSAPLWLAVAAAGLAAAHHHHHRHSFETDDIGTFAPEVPTPARTRGILAEEPIRYRPPKPDPLVTEQKSETTSTVLAVTAWESRDGWVPASGRLRLTVEGQLDGFHHGDFLEVTGRLAKPSRPANPGERDFRSHLLDDRITATLRVERSATSVTRLQEGWRSSLFGWLGVVRGSGTRSLQESIAPEESGLAAALLLGDTAAA
ncbi:MAG: ComEC/Rec2 family competence protein [Gemmataceae bacterium]